MEQATVAPAEPQGTIGADQDTSAPANGDNGAATPASFGSLYRAHVLNRAQAAADRAGVSSAGTATTTPDEQPAPSDRAVSRPGAVTSDGDDSAAVESDVSAAGQPQKLSRAQRKAAYQATNGTGATAPETATDDTATAPVADDPDPVVARVEQVEKTVSEGLSRIEGLIRPQPDPASAPPDEETVLYGPDAEYLRREEISLRGSTRGQYLDPSEADEFAIWSSNRKVRDRTSAQINQGWQEQTSALFLGAAEAFGVDAEAIQKPGTTLRDIFAAFVASGEAKKDAELTAANEKVAKLEAANKLLADENEAMQQRLPATARTVLSGGAGASTRGAALADRSRMTGRQLMGSGLSTQMQGRRNRPGAR